MEVMGLMLGRWVSDGEGAIVEHVIVLPRCAAGAAAAAATVTAAAAATATAAAAARPCLMSVHLHRLANLPHSNASGATASQIGWKLAMSSWRRRLRWQRTSRRGPAASAAS